MPRTILQQHVAADVSRLILIASKMAPTDVGGYFCVTFQS